MAFLLSPCPPRLSQDLLSCPVPPRPGLVAAKVSELTGSRSLRDRPPRARTGGGVAQMACQGHLAMVTIPWVVPDQSP